MSKKNLSKILLDSFKLLKKTLLPSLVFIIILSILIAFLKFFIFDLTNANWNLHQLSFDYQEIVEQIQADPNILLTPEMIYIQKSYATLCFLNLIVKSTLQFLFLICLLLFMTGKIYSLGTNTEENLEINPNRIYIPTTWLKSIKAPFRTKKHTLTSIFWMVAGSLFLTLGAMLMLVPGVLMMVYGLFSIHTMIIENKTGNDAFKGGKFFAKGNFSKIVIVIFLSFFIPLILMSLYLEPLMNFLTLTEENYYVWLNPESKKVGLLLLYEYSTTFFQNILYFWFPVIYTVLFKNIREEKLKEYIQSQSQSQSQKKIDIDNR